MIFLVVECALACYPVNFAFQLLNLCIKGSTVLAVVYGVRRLNSQLTHALEHGGNFFHSAFGRLREGDAIVSVANGHGEAANLRLHARSNGKTSSIIGSGINPATGRQPLHCLAHLLVGFAYVVLGLDRSHVRVDDKCHGYVLFLDVS
jgi:hypothetical protein